MMVFTIIEYFINNNLRISTSKFENTYFSFHRPPVSNWAFPRYMVLAWLAMPQLNRVYF